MENELELLSRYLAERHLDRLRNSPALDRIDYTFDMPLEGEGWHTRETDGSRFWRFTGPQCTSKIYFPKILAPERRLTLQIFHSVTPSHRDDLVVEYNGFVPVPVETEGQALTYQLPDAAVLNHDYVLIALTTPAPVVPDEGDDRLLGIGLIRIEVR